MSPHETLFRLEGTQFMERHMIDNNHLLAFEILDFPGEYGGGNTDNNAMYQSNASIEDNEGGGGGGFGGGGGGGGGGGEGDGEGSNPTDSELEGMDATSTAIIFVIDAQDEPYDNVLQGISVTIKDALGCNPKMKFEIFINKVDGELFLSDEAKFECRRDVMQQVTDELAMLDLEAEVAYYLTSIYDHSIFEAFSKVVQKLLPQLPTLENLLNLLVSTCSLEKAFLFDVVSKLYISTDSTPVDMQSYELCSDMIDVVLDVSGIYGVSSGGGGIEKQPSSLSVESQGGSSEGDAYDAESSSVIRLSNGMVLYLREVQHMLALVVLTRGENFVKKSLVDYNIGVFKGALGKLLTLESQN